MGNVQNTAGVNHFRCSAIAEILWSRRRLQEISKIQKIGEGYVIAVTLTPVAGLFIYHDGSMLPCLNRKVVKSTFRAFVTPSVKQNIRFILVLRPH